ncbi:MAG: hypothetical protein GF411_00665 [Candidatus Lokiarchaeota archaeon]|nr:hypothetical protein [Candidatus Lokiarchaeota archaeon]
MIDFKEMNNQALNASDKEAFRVLDSGPCHRIGVGVRIKPASETYYFLEVILSLGKSRIVKNFEELQKLINLVSVLSKRGFITKIQDDSSFLCEREMNQSDVMEEYESILNLEDFPPKYEK